MWISDFGIEKKKGRGPAAAVSYAGQADDRSRREHRAWSIASQKEDRAQ